MTSDTINILFVCLGNICRSPLAEGVFRHLAEAEGLEDRFEIDSAGTSAYHIGESPDERAREVARQRGIVYGGSARQVDERDLERFDYVIVMDESNLEAIEMLAERSDRAGAEVRMLREFDPEAAGDLDVPDPYFGGPQGFETVHDIVERSCRGLLEHVREERGF